MIFSAHRADLVALVSVTTMHCDETDRRIDSIHTPINRCTINVHLVAIKTTPVISTYNSYYCRLIFKSYSLADSQENSLYTRNSNFHQLWTV